MGKKVDNTVLDAALGIIDNATSMIANTAEPADRAAAVADALATATMTAGSDYTIADGTTSGRKVTTAVKNSVSVTASGTATHISLCDASTLLYVTTCTSQALTSGNTVNFPAWKVEIADPT